MYRSYRGRQRDLGLGVVDREMLKATSTPSRWHVIGHSRENSGSKWYFLNTWYNQSYYSVLPCIYHVWCHNLTFCFNVMDSTEMMHILKWHVLITNKRNRPFLGTIHVIQYIRHSILVRSTEPNVFQHSLPVRESVVKYNTGRHGLWIHFGSIYIVTLWLLWYYHDLWEKSIG